MSQFWFHVDFKQIHSQLERTIRHKTSSKTTHKATPLEFIHLRRSHISKISLINQKNVTVKLSILAMHEAMLKQKSLSNQTASSSGQHIKFVWKKTEPDAKSALRNVSHLCKISKCTDTYWYNWISPTKILRARVNVTSPSVS